MDIFLVLTKTPQLYQKRHDSDPLICFGSDRVGSSETSADDKRELDAEIWAKVGLFFLFLFLGRLG